MEKKREIEKTMIKCDGVSKTFENNNGKKEVVKDFNLEVKENEFLVLFGPGQCGKSTIINLIAGLEMSSSGEIFVDDKLVIEPGPDRGVVFQTIALFPWLTVMGNVEYGLKSAGVSKKERRKVANHYIEMVGLTGFEKSYPIQLSGGMKQRTGIARAYSIKPKVILMDEPFGHLDAQTRYLMQEELNKIYDAERRTIVFVTNSIEEAIYLADRIVLLTSCPANIKREYVIDLPRPRSYVDKEFLELRKEISMALDKTV